MCQDFWHFDILLLETWRAKEDMSSLIRRCSRQTLGFIQYKWKPKVSQVWTENSRAVGLLQTVFYFFLFQVTVWDFGVNMKMIKTWSEIKNRTFSTTSLYCVISSSTTWWCCCHVCSCSAEVSSRTGRDFQFKSTVTPCLAAAQLSHSVWWCCHEEGVQWVKCYHGNIIFLMKA